MNKKKFLIIGRTASGKSTITNEVCEILGLKQVKSYTTRQPRGDEAEKSRDHYFVSEEEYQQIFDTNEIVAFTVINGIRYCATRNELNNSDTYVVDPMGIKNMFDLYGDEYDFVKILIKVPYNLGLQRALMRGDDINTYEQRYANESKQFYEFESQHLFDYCVVNDGDIKVAVNKVVEIIAKEMAYGKSN